jgi:hypothetical protein
MIYMYANYVDVHIQTAEERCMSGRNGWPTTRSSKELTSVTIVAEGISSGIRILPTSSLFRYSTQAIDYDPCKMNNFQFSRFDVTRTERLGDDWI